MTNSEIFSQRDELNKTMVATLSMYGNLEPPGVVERPYNESAKSKYQFTATNYLRLLAAQKERSLTDPRWVSDSYVKTHNYTLKDGASPVGIEYWKGIDGKGYQGELKNFWNAADIVEYNDIPLENRKGNEQDDFEYAIDLLNGSGAKLSSNANAKQIFEAAKAHAVKEGSNEFSSALAAQLILKSSHISYDYTKNPLFNEEQLEKLEKNPKILFNSMKQAQKVLDKLIYVQEKHLAEMMNRAQMEHEAITRDFGTREPFRNLTVEFEWSEGLLKDMDGKPYERNTTLTGEDAYKFLVQLNAADKEVFNQRPKGGYGYDKTKLSISYGAYNHGEMRIDLGDLELCNKSTITEALTERLSSYRNTIMEDKYYRSKIIDRHKDENLTEEQLIAECKEEAKVFAEEMEQFALEERRYLAVHPEIRAINDKKADAYLLACSAEEFDLIPQSYVMNLHEASSDMSINLAKGANRPENPIQILPADSIVFESRFPIDSELAKNLPVHAVITGDEKLAITNIADKLNIEFIDNGPIIGEKMERDVTSLKGAEAIAEFIKEKSLDINISRDIYKMNMADRSRMHQKEMVFSYDGKEFARLSYEPGTGKLNQTFPSGFPENSDKNLNEEMQKGVYAMLRLNGVNHNDYLSTLYSKERIQLPDLASMQDEVKKSRPPARTINTKKYDYYEKLAAQDLSLDSREAVMKAMLEHMKKDELPPIKIENIVKINPDFDTKLLPERKKATKKTVSPKKPKEKTEKLVAEKQESYQRKR